MEFKSDCHDNHLIPPPTRLTLLCWFSDSLHPPLYPPDSNLQPQKAHKSIDLVTIVISTGFLFWLQEKFPDGRQIISFSDGTRKVISAGGEEEISFPDKTLVIKDSSGERVVRLPQSDSIRRNVRKSLRTTLETRIEKGNSSSKVSLPPQPHQRDVMVL